MSFALKIESFTKPAKNNVSPRQAKPKNKPHANPAFAIFVEKAAKVTTDFGDGFENRGQPSRKNSGAEGTPGSGNPALGAPGKQGMVRQDVAERVTRG